MERRSVTEKRLGALMERRSVTETQNSGRVVVVGVDDIFGVSHPARLPRAPQRLHLHADPRSPSPPNFPAASPLPKKSQPLSPPPPPRSTLPNSAATATSPLLSAAPRRPSRSAALLLASACRTPSSATTPSAVQRRVDPSPAPASSPPASETPSSPPTPSSSSPPGTSSATSTAARSSGLHAPNFTNPSAASAARSPAPELHRRLSRQREGYRWTRRSRSQSPPASQTCSCNGAAGSGSDASSHAKTARRRQPGRMRSGAPYPGSIGPFLEGMSHSFVHHAARALSTEGNPRHRRVRPGSRCRSRRRRTGTTPPGVPHFPLRGMGLISAVEWKRRAPLPCRGSSSPYRTRRKRRTSWQ